MYVNVLLLLICVCITGAIEATPQLKVEDGFIRGQYLTSRNGRTYSAYRGIPYAKPPTGKLRFQVSMPPSPWKNVYDATYSRNVCPQRNSYANNTLIGDEDCLYLNVYTPQIMNTSNEVLPVMFFIHGGAQKSWSGNYEDFNPELLMDKDVVLVAPTYRLGALGFLSTGDEVVPGNNGLKDQNLALKWVKRNIDVFGGDSKRITLFGESSGAMNTHLHMMSPLSRDLIYGAIAQSGTACSWRVVSEVDAGTARTKQLATLLNCTHENNLAMVECLRKIPAFELVKQDVHSVIWNNMPLRHFIPVVEPNIPGAFLTQHPIDMYKKGLVAKIPFMLGFNTEEGAFHASGAFANSQHVKRLNDDFNEIVSTTVGYKGLTSDDDSISKSIRTFYFQDNTIDESSQSKMSLTKMYTDAWRMQMGTDNSAILHTKFTDKPVYYYVFGYRASSSFTDVLGGSGYNYGVSHADELLHLFKIGIMPNYKPSATDIKVTELLLTLWTNFAKTGNPNIPTNNKQPAEWKPFSGNESSNMYYITNSNDIRMVDEPFPSRFKFWKNLSIEHNAY